MVSAWRRSPEQAAEFFRSPTAPTGVLAWSDRDAVALLSVLAHAGVGVPDEVSLVGYEALAEGERVCPALTTVDNGWCQQLQAAFRLLTGAAPPPHSHTTLVVPTLVLRESTGPPPR
jgi:DNA-binding LacI/PurR family transcriptional regulator